MSTAGTAATRASIQEVLHRKAFPPTSRFGLLHPRTGGDSVEPIMTTPSSSSLADVIGTSFWTRDW